jgi:hypothetical protein
MVGAERSAQYRIPKVLIPYLGACIDYSAWAFVEFVISSELRDSNSGQATTTSFHIPSSSLFADHLISRSF